ncbi:MAG: TOBE domain-containing protein [Erysipelotrichaceae bacterium]|nr:TOBE domain-containing protein [Erysipelotrichaceae bacterium]
MISARNKIRGVVSEVVPGAVMGIVKVDAGEKEHLSATISMESVKDLRLEQGKKVVAVVKATEIMLAKDYVTISARNQLKGMVVSVEKGAVNAIVKLDVPGGIGITSTVSIEAVDQLGIKVGQPAVAVIKATSVMIAAD